MDEKFVDVESFNETVEHLQEQTDRLKREVAKSKRRTNDAN